MNRRMYVLVLVALLTASIALAQPVALVVDSGIAPVTTVLADAVSKRLGEAGYAPRTVGYGALCDADALAANETALLALTNAAALPVCAVGPLTAYLEAGGDIIALGAPLWQTQLLRDGEEWVDRETYGRRHAARLLQHTLLAWEDLPEGWRRSTNEASTTTIHETVQAEGADFAHALHVRIADLSNWDTYVSPLLEQPFPDSHTMTVFYAKGDANTPELLVEWEEKDGSRWLATVPLTTEWRQYVLEPANFHYWQSVPARKGTGFNPANAHKLSIGLALSHTRIFGPEHEYWVGPFGTAAPTPEHQKMLTRAVLPRWDTLSPGYKLFECTGVKRLAARPGNAWLADAEFPVPGLVHSPHPRPGAGGFDKGRAWRFEPLIEAFTADGEWRGHPATLLVHAEGPYAGGVWASFGVGGAGWYRDPAVLDTIGAVARQMRRGVFFIDAGTNYYTYFLDQRARVGARMVNTSAHPAEVEVAIDVAKVGGASYGEEKRRLTLEPGASSSIEWDGPTGGAMPGEGIEVTARLLSGGELVDHVTHRAHVWKPKEDPKFIEAKDGNFALDGKRWRANGVIGHRHRGPAVFRVLAGRARLRPRDYPARPGALRGHGAQRRQHLHLPPQHGSAEPARPAAPARRARHEGEPVAPARHAHGLRVGKDARPARILPARAERHGVRA